MIPALDVPIASTESKQATTSTELTAQTRPKAKQIIKSPANYQSARCESILPEEERQLTNEMTNAEKRSLAASRFEDSISLDGLEFRSPAAIGGGPRRKVTPLEQCNESPFEIPKSMEKSVIIHKDENGFGLRVKGQAPVFVEHVHENGAAWRAGVRRYDIISKVNGTPVSFKDHKDVVLKFKSCTRFVGLTLLSSISNITSNHHHQTNIGSPERLDLGATRGAANLFQLQEAASSRKLRVTNSRRSTSQDATPCGGSMLTSDPILIEGETLFDFQRPDQQHQTSKYQVVFEGEQLTSNQVTSKLICPDNMSSDDKNYFHSCAALLQLQQISRANQNSGCQSASIDSNGAELPAIPYRLPLENRRIQQLIGQTLSPRRSESVSARPSYLNFLHIQDKQTGEDRYMRFCVQCNQPVISSVISNSNDQFCYCDQCQHKLANVDENNQLRVSVDSSSSSSLSALGVFRSLRDSSNPKYNLIIGSNQQPNQQLGHKQQESSSVNKIQAISKQIGPHPSGKLLNRQQTSHDIKMSDQFSARSLNKLAQSASTNSLPSDAAVASAAAAAAASAFSGQPIPGIMINNKRTNKRSEIVRELIDTERTHTERLGYLDELFYKPLKAGNFMSREQLRQVFSCHRTLNKIHRRIYHILLSANYKLSEEPMIGSALLEIFEGDLKRRLERAACTFCSAQSTNAELLNKLTRKDTKVGEFIAQVTSQQMIGRLGIKDLLASCFQRLTKYPLLLENLLKAIPKPETAHIIELERYSTPGQMEEKRSQMEQEVEDQMSSPEELEKARNSDRMLAISLEEEREFIERALAQSRQILVRVNDAIRVAMSHNKLKEIWKRTDKYPGVPLIDITKQQIVHDGLLTLRLSKRSFDVYVLLLNDYLIILTREGQDKYRLKFFTPDGKSSSNPQSVYSPVFVIDEHLTTRDAATDENGFYLLCKRKDDSRIYEFASRSPAERMKWRDRIQWTIERQMSKGDRRPSCVSTITKSSSEISGKRDIDDPELELSSHTTTTTSNDKSVKDQRSQADSNPSDPIEDKTKSSPSRSASQSNQSPKKEPTKIEGTISYVEDDGIVMPSKMESSRAFVSQAIQVNILDAMRKQITTT